MFVVVGIVLLMLAFIVMLYWFEHCDTASEEIVVGIGLLFFALCMCIVAWSIVGPTSAPPHRDALSVYMAAKIGILDFGGHMHIAVGILLLLAAFIIWGVHMGARKGSEAINTLSRFME